MADEMVLETQRWLNTTYGADSRFNTVEENGRTGWPTIYALTRALQIELGIAVTADNFGAGTESRFKAQFPNGITEQPQGATSTSNVYAIIQGALWCKGYSTGGHITTNFYGGTGNAVRQLKEDMGFGDGSTVDVEVMKSLLSMKQFVLLTRYGGLPEVRQIQQDINREYRSYTGIVPTDGLYGREMNKALIQVLQAIQGYTPAQATGNFGDGTRSRLITINESNAASYPKWVWLTTVAMICNGFGDNPRETWDPSFIPTIKDFQRRYAIAETGQVDPTTWMSLLTSKGDPNRAAIACDTRFEITQERLDTLTADGYQIVGRYLTEPNQSQKQPEDYFKAIRPGELERITAGGMKFFPIFQENSRLLSDFTPANGARHAHEARAAAQRLGIPPTTIYFAVDMDILGDQIEPYIEPYFRAILSNLSGGYSVGIYASRNVCAQVIKAELAGSAFVSDMSSGFSGNLGFAIPEAWNYDQFTEISNYKGQGWDLDRVAYSGLVSPVSYVNPQGSGGVEVAPGLNYYTMDPLDLVWHLENRFEELRAEGKVGESLVGEGLVPVTPPVWYPVDTWQCIANYLAKDYLRDGDLTDTVEWAIAAQSFRRADGSVLESDPIASEIIAGLDRYISSSRQPMVDSTGDRVDLSHLMATFLGYVGGDIIPNKWTGWAGDLATAMKNIQKVMDWNPSADLEQVAQALVGQDENYRSHPGLAGLVLDKKIDGTWDFVDNECNRDDLCCDGDAITLAKQLSAGNGSNPHLLSQTLRTYYNDSTQLANRFKQIAWDHNATDRTQAQRAFLFQVTDDPFNATLRDKLDKGANPEVVEEACVALANFVF